MGTESGNVGGTCRPPTASCTSRIFRWFGQGPIGQGPTGLMLVNLGKIGSNSFWVCRLIFDDNIKNGDFQKVGTTPPIEKALVNKKVILPKLEILDFRDFQG